MTNLAIQKHTAEVIKKPRVTEKGVLGGEKGMYVFEVHKSATKPAIMKAIKEYLPQARANAEGIVCSSLTQEKK